MKTLVKAKTCKCARCGRWIAKGKELYSTGKFYGPVCYKKAKNKFDDEEYKKDEIQAPVFVAPSIDLDENEATDAIIANYIHQDIGVNILRKGTVLFRYSCTEIDKAFHRKVA